MSTSPFEDLLALITSVTTVMEPADNQPSAGSLSDVKRWLAKKPSEGKQSGAQPEIHLCIFASSYEGGDDPQKIQAELKKLQSGSAVVSPYCVRSGLGLRVLEMAVDVPHRIGNTNGDSWSEKDVVATIAFGMEAAAAQGDLLGLASYSPGGEPYAKAILSCLTGVKIEGSAGLNDASFDTDRDQNSAHAVFTLLQNWGGRDIAAGIGGILGAMACRLPVLIEGWSMLASYALLNAMAGNVTPEATLFGVKLAAFDDDAQKSIAEYLNLSPLIGTVNDVGVGCGLALAADQMVSVLQAG